MATAITAAKLGGMAEHGHYWKQLYTLPLQTTTDTGIMTVDLTADFSRIIGAFLLGNDTLADNGYKVQAVEPGPTVAVTATNLAISVHWMPAIDDAGEAAQALAPVTETDLTSVGALKMLVIGKRAI